MNNQNDHDTYIIPPNFVDTGTFFGGMFRARNVIEAGILAVATGLPVFLFLPFGLTARIIVLCLTTLPLVLFALIGISGESLSSFLVIFLKYMKNRRIVGGGESQETVRTAASAKKVRKSGKKKNPVCSENTASAGTRQEMKTDRSNHKSVKNEKIGGISGWRRRGEEDFPAEFDQIKGYEIRQKLRPSQTQKKQQDGTQRKKSAGGRKRGSQQDSRKKAAGKSAGPDHRNNWQKKGRSPRKPLRTPEPQFTHLNPVADYLPIRKIENGIIYTKDHRYVKVVEVIPINFLLRSAREQRSIIYSFVSYLKISPVKLQFKVLTRRADIGRHMETVRREMAQETNGQCRLMQEDYLQFIQQICSREAVTRRFFLVFEYEPWNGARRTDEEGEAIGSLQSAVHTASNYLRQCGNEVVLPDNEDEFTIDVLYNLLCRNESAAKPLPVRAKEVVAQYLADGRESDIDHIPAGEFIAPRSIDFTHGRYICIDGLYYAYLLIHTYNKKGITHDNASLADPKDPARYREMPVLGDLYGILKKSAATKRLANILNRLVNGSASTFNQQTNVSLDNKYTVLDISSLTGDLLTVGMFVALDFVRDRAKEDRTEEKTIFIDECWQLLSGAGATGTRLAGDFVLEIFKTIRGYGGSAVCASQDLNDFFNLDEGRFGKGIINNSKTKIILNLEDDEAMRVQSALHLSDAEVMEVTHFERGNGLISTNNNNIMVEFKASPLEKDLITTDRRELKDIVERMRRQSEAG